MRLPLASAAILVAFSLGAFSLGAFSLGAFSLGAASAQDSKSTDQPEASKAPPTSSEQQKGEQAVSSKSGQNGKEEPGSHAPTQDAAVFVNGKLNVPGAPADSQTVPAKFSERNNAIDHTPIMAMPLSLSDEQKKAVLAGVKLANKPVQSTDAKAAQELPWDITVHDLGPSANDPMLAKLKYVRTQDRVLLIDAPNRIVVGEIKG